MKPEKLLLRTGCKRFGFYKLERWELGWWLNFLKVILKVKQFLPSINRVTVEDMNKNVYMEQHFCKFPIY